MDCAAAYNGLMEKCIYGMMFCTSCNRLLITDELGFWLVVVELSNVVVPPLFMRCEITHHMMENIIP